MTIIKMTGSPKQIEWATDIITRPYTVMENQAKHYERLSDKITEYGEIAELIRKAMQMYEAGYSAAASQRFASASVVIDQRCGFKSAAEAAIGIVFQDAGKFDKIQEVMANFNRAF